MHFFAELTFFSLIDFFRQRKRDELTFFKKVNLFIKLIRNKDIKFSEFLQINNFEQKANFEF